MEAPIRDRSYNEKLNYFFTAGAAGGNRFAGSVRYDVFGNVADRVCFR